MILLLFIVVVCKLIFTASHPLLSLPDKTAESNHNKPPAFLTFEKWFHEVLTQGELRTNAHPTAQTFIHKQ